MTYAKKARALIAALVLTVAIPTGVFAAESTNVAESFTVASTIAVSGIPSSIPYGSGSTLGGNTITASSPITVTYSTNNATGARLTMTGTDFTHANGTIPSTARFVSVVVPAGNAWIVPNPTYFDGDTFDGSVNAAAGAAGVPVNLVNTTKGIEIVAAVHLSVHVPTDAVPGAYTGTVTFTVADNS